MEEEFGGQVGFNASITVSNLLDILGFPWFKYMHQRRG